MSNILVDAEITGKDGCPIVPEQDPKYLKGDGINSPDLKLFVGAYITVTYWQADPENNQQPVVYIKNDNRSDNAVLAFHSNHLEQLVDVLSFVNKQIN